MWAVSNFEPLASRGAARHKPPVEHIKSFLSLLPSKPQLLSFAMGNITSSSIALPADPPPYSRRKPSILSRLIGCGSTSEERSDEVPQLEDKAYNDQPQATPPPAYFSSAILATASDPASQEFAKFLLKYPGQQSVRKPVPLC